jgi:PAS domain S-box-containing protein
MYGWTVEEARGQVTHTLLRTRFPVSPQEVERALEQCGRWEGELVHTRRDGAQIVVESRQVLLRDEAGQPTAILEINREITARKRAEDALRESEERLQALVHASSEVLYSMSPDWTEMRELSGGGFMADTQSPSRTWLGRYIHPDDQPRVTAAIQEAVRTKSVYELEHRVRRVDGSLGWALSRAVPRFGADDKITEWFGAASDVTARKAAEEALRAALAEQQALLREVNHRVKNNLAVINSLLRLQAADIDDARTRQALTEAASRVRAIGVVHRLLYDAPTLAPVDLGRFAEELAQALFASYGVSAERVRFALSGDQLGTDLERAVPVGLILNELVTNALKYAFPGERAGRVEVWIDAERGVLELFDDGVGLPPSVDLAHPRTLGLQLVQALVRQVGGTLQLLPGPGTHYQLQLPPVQACQAGGSSLSRRSSAS